MADKFQALSKSAFEFQSQRNWLQHFYAFDFSAFERAVFKSGEQQWVRAGEKRALAVFHAAAERVPAYRDFLKKNKVRHAAIKTIADFQNVPLTSKDNYIYKYPMAQRCWDGKLSGSQVMSMSSGTTGAPALWPRSGYQLFEAAIGHELLLKKAFNLPKHRTLLLIGFPMGVYVSGMAETQSITAVANKGYNLTVATCGNNKNDMLRLVRELSAKYDQVILEGHPFFIKDVLETGKQQGLRWPKMNLGLIFCSEGFSESWRDYILKETGMAGKTHRVISTYGSSEMLLMAYESDLSQLVRQRLDASPDFSQAVSGQRAAPSIFQYNPLFRHIETMGNELLFTSASGVPLIRFNLHDSGRVLGFAQIAEAFRSHGQPLAPLKARYAKSWHWPFLLLNGRSDQTVVFYAANIYPEHIHAALNHRAFLPKITGKFALRKAYYKNMDEFLEVNIELKRGVKPSKKLEKSIQGHLVKTLRQLNLEYLFLCNHLDKDIIPKIKLLTNGHEPYFKPGLKPRYIVE